MRSTPVLKQGTAKPSKYCLNPFTSRASESECVGCLRNALYASAKAGHSEAVQILLEPFRSRASEIECVGGLRDALQALSSNNLDIYELIFQCAVSKLSYAALEKVPDKGIAIIRNMKADETMLGGSSSLCAICINEDNRVALGDEVRVLPCNHWYHTGCFYSWLRIRRNCPMCRRKA